MITFLPKPKGLPAADAKYVVVEASAGTGKTFFLQHHVLDLMIAQGAELAQIQVVTFTEKATAELRRRIRESVDSALRASTIDPAATESSWRIDEEARKRLAAARLGFGNAAISTIHGFCQRVLIDEAFLAGRLFEQTRVSDETVFHGAFFTVLRETLANAATEQALLAAFLGAGGTVDNLYATLLACARKPHASFAPAPSLEELVSAAEVVVAAARRLGVATFPGGGTVAMQRQRYERLNEIAEAIAPHLVAAQQDSPSVVAPALLAAIDSLFRGGRSKGVLANVPDSFGPGNDPLRLALRTLSGAQRLVAHLAQRWLPMVLEKIAIDKLQLAQFDYHDLLASVWQSLASSRGSDLAASIRAKLPWVMIDEFQDTDELQWNIFRSIWVHPQAKGLTIVGDPKQSIYGFRGADVNVYLRARDELLAAGGQASYLTTNYRASSQLVDAVNHILIGDPLNQMFDQDVRYDQPVRSSGDVVGPLGPAVTIVTTDGKRAAYGQWVVNEIERLLAEPVVYEQRGVLTKTKPSDILVLTRSSREGDELADLLSARGIASSRVQQERLFHTSEAKQLAAVFEAIANPRDRNARIRALRTRFFAVPWRVMASVANSTDTHSSVALLAHWQELAAARKYDRLFASLVDDSGIATRTLGLGASERVLINTYHVLDLLAERAARSPVEFSELSGLLASWIAGVAARADELDVQRMETDGDAVSIMSTHRSKGLEAAVVFIYGFDGRPPPVSVEVYRAGPVGTEQESFSPGAQSGANQRTLGSGARYFAIGNTAAEQRKLLEADADQESRRLLYVALTRAKVRLYLPSYKPPDRSVAQVLHPRLVAIESQINRGDASARKLFRMVATTGAATQAEAEDEFESGQELTGTSVPKQLLDTVEELTIEPPVGGDSEFALSVAQTYGELLSYSRLARRAKAKAQPALVATDGVDRVDEVNDPAEPLAEDDLPAGANSGLFVHALLEHFDLNAALVTDAASPTASPLQDWAATIGAQFAIRNPAHVEKGLKMAQDCLRQAIVTGGLTFPPLASAKLAREVEFMFPSSERVFVRGALDALVTWNDVDLWIVDYKTDLLAVNSSETALLEQAAAAKVAQHYRQQTLLYTLAARRMCNSQQRVAGMLFAFVRHRVWVAAHATEQDLAATMQEIGAP